MEKQQDKILNVTLTEYLEECIQSINAIISNAKTIGNFKSKSEVRNIYSNYEPEIQHRFIDLKDDMLYLTIPNDIIKNLKHSELTYLCYHYKKETFKLISLRHHNTKKGKHPDSILGIPLDYIFNTINGIEPLIPVEQSQIR